MYALLPQTPETCLCYAESHKDEFGKIQSSCPLYTECVMDDSVDPAAMGDCGVKETSANWFWCKCFGEGEPPKEAWPDDCMCKSGWKWSPTSQDASPRCMMNDCTYTCFTVDDDEVPSAPASIPNCECRS
jgi:hypothetical protein